MVDAGREVVADTEAVAMGGECLVAAAVTKGECRGGVSHGAAVQEAAVPLGAVPLGAVREGAVREGVLILAVLHAPPPQEIILFPIAVLLYLDRVSLRDRSIPLRTELPGRL